jgi:hypothetical protein
VTAPDTDVSIAGTASWGRDCNTRAAQDANRTWVGPIDSFLRWDFPGASRGLTFKPQDNPGTLTTSFTTGVRTDDRYPASMSPASTLGFTIVVHRNGSVPALTP